MTRRPQLVFDRPGVPRRSFGNPAASGASSGANSKRDPLPPPSYSEVEGLDLPDYRDLEFADENFKLDCDEEVVRRKADAYAVDKEMERGDSHFGYEVTSGEGGEEEDQGGRIISRKTGQEQRGTLPKMNTTEKSGEADLTSRRSIFVQIDEAENQIVVTENQMVDTELEEGGRAILGKVSVKDDRNVVEHVALLEPVLDQPGVSELQHNERENEGEEDILDGTEMDMDKGMRREDGEKEASAKGEEYKEEIREEKKKNGVANMEEHFMREMGNWEGGKGIGDTAGGESTEEYVTREGEKEERREMKGEGDKEKEEKVKKEKKVERREEEGEKEPVPPVWDTVLVQHGDVQGTQV